MSLTPERLDQALNILRERGHKLATKPGAFKAADGRTLVTIDDQLRTVQEICEMAAFEEHKYDEGSSFVPDNPEGIPHILGRWVTDDRVILAIILQGENGRFRIQFDLGKVTLPDGRNIPVRLVWEGSDRTLEMAQQGAEAIVQSRFHVFSEVVWLPELSPQP
jgi:hypothetical protein